MDIRRSWSLIACAVWAVAPGLAADPQYDLKQALARELISVMKLDEQAIQKVEKRILDRCRAEHCDADLRQCLMKFDRQLITLYLESDVVKELRPDEMRDAIAYFRSETGLKHLDILRAEQGLGGDQTLFNQTPETRARMIAFLDTRAGYLVITRGVLTNRANAMTNSRASMSFWRCQPAR